MKKKDLQKEYENINISIEEKNKIFNAIMDNRKKRNNWIPFVSFGTVAVAAVGAFFLFGPLANNLSTVNAALENNYRKEIIVNAKTYLAANNIDVTELEDGKKIEIDSKEIVKDEEYSACSGKLIVKRYNEDYTYTTNVTCGKTKGSETEFRIYDGKLRNVFEVGEEIAVVSRGEYETFENGTIKKGDANITLFSDNGEILWSKKIKSLYEDENSVVDVLGINKLNDDYVVILSMQNHKDMHQSEIYYYELLLNIDDNKEEYKFLETEDYDNIFVDKFIGATIDALFYESYYITDYQNGKKQNAILKITKDNYELINYEKTNYFDKVVADDEIGLATQREITASANNNFYGFSRTKSDGSNNSLYYESKTIFKLDENGSIAWENDINLGIEKEEEYFITNVFAFNNYIHVIYTNGTKTYVLSYDDKFKLVNKLDVNEIINSNTTVKNIRYENNEYIIEGLDITNTINFFIKLNNNFKVITKVDVNETLINESFEWKHLYYSRLKEDNVNMIYSAKERIAESESILIAFYK